MKQFYKSNISRRNNFIIISLILLLFISIFNNLFFITESRIGNEYILIYFCYSILFLYLSVYILELSSIKKKIFMIFFLYKIPISFLMIYLIINKWDGGDLNGYYYRVIDTINSDNTIHGFSNVMVIQQFNYVIFHILPNSLYGMVFFYAYLSMVSYLLIYKIFSQYAFNNSLLFIFLLMIPTITLQSSFFGKDAYMLLFIGFIFLLFSKIETNRIFTKKKNFLFITLFSMCLFLIFCIRSYQAAIIVVALYLTFISKNKFTFIVGSFIAIIGSIFLFKLIIITFLGNIDLSNFNFSNALANVYKGGSLMLESYPIPFHMLQIFRPFPWEANSIFMLFVSIEHFLLLSIIIYLIKRNYRKIINRIKENKLYLFLFFYVFVSIFIYSFNPNMGDMTRRAIYFIPFLMVLLV
jgi:hypothetical protein